jgi:LacI family transcriptional regulator
MMHIIHAAAQQGFLVEIIPGDAAELATKNLVDGIIEVGLTAQELKAMTHLPPVPTVLTNKGRLQETWYTVCSDHFEESEIAVSCLLENGHRSMALVLDEQEGWGPENRRAGFEQSLAGIPGTQGTVLSIQDMGPQQCAAELTAAGCTAAILFTDNAGFGVFDALVNDQHLHVPDDISLIMLENRSVSRFIAPRLTTIAQPLQEIAIAAVERIVQSLQDDSVQKNTVFHSCLIKRKSVRCMGQALK